MQGFRAFKTPDTSPSDVTVASARLLLLAASLSVLSQAPLAAQSANQRPAAETPTDPEARGEAAPVLIGGEPVIWITSAAASYTPQFRADRISRRAAAAILDSKVDPVVTVKEIDGSSELSVGTHLLMVVTAQDASNLGVARAALAAQYAQDLERAIRAERQRYSPAALFRSSMIALGATLALVLVLWSIARFMRWLRSLIGRWQTRQVSLRLQQAELVSAEKLARSAAAVVRITRIALLLLAVNLYLTLVLGLFPWTRAVSLTLLGYLTAPLETTLAAFIAYLPNLLFLIVITTIIYAAVRLVAFLFRQIEHGRIVLSGFPVEWAAPTDKIARVLLIAFGLVVAFPYLPASDSAAFAGVSVFIGILFSLSSSSAIANMIAGIVLTYTRAFRLGDRVKLGDAYGDIVETALLATRIRTIKNAHVTIPNSIVLGSSITNYSRMSATSGLVLHTSVTIGYSAPWRQVHELLIGAALKTPGLLHEPPPFVWQTALNDFYVTYEINAYTNAPQDMDVIYAALHAAIQDAFHAAGVEIMSPHFTSLRDGNTVAIPEALRPAGYQAPAFRVENAASSAAGAMDAGAVARTREHSVTADANPRA
jgi:small-conductance mechanosensitive channel